MNNENTPVGDEYVVSYVLSDYQKGSLVARFPGQPSPARLREFLSGYSISASDLAEVNATPVPRLNHGQIPNRPAPTNTALGQSLTIPPGRTTSSTRPASTSESKGENVAGKMMVSLLSFFSFFLVLLIAFFT